MWHHFALNFCDKPAAMSKPISDAQFFFLRLSKTSLRAVHVAALMGAGSGFLFQLESSLWQPWWLAAMISGGLLMIWEIWRSPLWLVQLKGACTIAKLGLVGLCYPLPSLAPYLFISVALISVFIAHGPSQFRHYSLWHRRVLSGKEVKG